MWVTTSGFPQNQFVKYTDQHPARGKNFYRLKVVYAGKAAAATRPVMVIIGKPGNNWVMYPVPVKDVLNLLYNGSDIIAGVIGVTIQNTQTRQVFHRLRMASTTRHMRIPVSNLGRGLYLVTISISNKVVWSQQFSK